MKTLVCALAGILLAAGLLAGPARADEAVVTTNWPVKPLRLIVGFTPGSAADLVARLVAQPLGDALGQPVIVDNRPGAGSNIAGEVVVGSPADGYTLLLLTVANTINVTLNPHIRFDMRKDLRQVAALASFPNLLVLHPSVQAQSVATLIAYAKAHPGALLFGSSGNGTSPHLSGELFNEMAGIKLVHVPYKGSPQAVTDLLADRVQVMFSPASSVLPYLHAGSLKALASTGAKRSSAFPELPTVAESGLAGFDTSVWLGISAPKATPDSVVARVAQAAATAMKETTLRHQLSTQGADPMDLTPLQFQHYVDQEIGKWATVIKVSGATVD